jgi:hypothetical protein
MAKGGKVDPWAKKHKVGLRTAYHWSKLPHCAEMIRTFQGEIRARMLGRCHGLVDKAMKNISDMMDNATNETVRYSANRNLILDMTTLKAHEDFERRLSALERANGTGNVSEAPDPT